MSEEQATQLELDSGCERAPCSSLGSVIGGWGGEAQPRAMVMEAHLNILNTLEPGHPLIKLALRDHRRDAGAGRAQDDREAAVKTKTPGEAPNDCISQPSRAS